MHTKLVKEEKHDSSINHLQKGMIKKLARHELFFILVEHLVNLVYFFVGSIALEIEEMLLTVPFPIE